MTSPESAPLVDRAAPRAKLNSKHPRTVTRTTVFESYDSHAVQCRDKLGQNTSDKANYNSSENPHRPDQRRVQCMRIAMISTMRTARPTTWSPLSLFEAGTAPFDPASSCFCFFCRLDPANPFIARQRRNVLPRLQRFCVGGQCLF